MRDVSTETLVKVLGFTPSAEQLTAITSPAHPALVLAGAGTGKTTVMAGRIAYLVLSGQMRPDQVIGLTFTTKACNELLVRVREIMKRVTAHLPETALGEDLGEPTISTYNAFGSRLLKEHALRLGLEPDARIMVDALRYQLAFKVVANTKVNLGELGYEVSGAVTDLLAFDQNLTNYMVISSSVVEQERELVAKYEQDSYAEEIHERMISASRKRIALCGLVDEFRAAKIAHDVIDYSDQIRLAATAAARSPEMCALLQEEFKAVLLDEYQDTSISQRNLLTSLFAGMPHVMAVGDPLQAIYRWRGAEVTNMATFENDFALVSDSGTVKATTFPLTQSRRSGVNILAVANDLSSTLRTLHPEIQELVPGNPDVPAGEVTVALHHTFADEVKWVVQKIQQLDPAIDRGDVAVLMRERKTIGHFVSALEAAGIQVQVSDAAALFSVPEVREVISYLQVIADPTANAALARILMSPRWSIGARDLAILGTHAAHLGGDRVETKGMHVDLQLEHLAAGVDRSERLSLLDALELVSDSKYAYSSDARERMQLAAQELRELRRHAGESAVDLIARVIRVTGLGVESMIRDLPSAGTHFDRLAMLLDLAGAFRNLDGDSTLYAFLAYVADSDRYHQSVSMELPVIKGAVCIMTMHKAKGLEFPVVIIPNVTKAIFPSTTTDDYWPHTQSLVPPQYVDAPQDELLVAFPASIDTIATDFDAHKARVRALQALDESRLGYVAVTRAEHSIYASSSWWGPTQSRKRGPSEFLRAMKDHATTIDVWVDEPAQGAKNPVLVDPRPALWPAAVASHILASRAEQAALVESMRGQSPYDIDQNIADEVAAWDKDIAVLLAQGHAARLDSRTVRLPSSLSASQVLALRKDPELFLKNLLRPMPRQPSASADRGTVFHAWVENFYGDRGLFDPENLPGSVDHDIYSDEFLESLKTAFTDGPFATRTPSGLETPFALVVAGRTWRGRIDAIFKGSLTDPTQPDRWLVVDWKTGRAGSADELQLHIYRLAWAQVNNVPVESIDAAFYYVGDGVVEPLTTTMTLEDLAALL